MGRCCAFVVTTALLVNAFQAAPLRSTRQLSDEWSPWCSQNAAWVCTHELAVHCEATCASPMPVDEWSPWCSQNAEWVCGHDLAVHCAATCPATVAPPTVLIIGDSIAFGTQTSCRLPDGQEVFPECSPQVNMAQCTGSATPNAACPVASQAPAEFGLASAVQKLLRGTSPDAEVWGATRGGMSIEQFAQDDCLEAFLPAAIDTISADVSHVFIELGSNDLTQFCDFSPDPYNPIRITQCMQRIQAPLVKAVRALSSAFPSAAITLLTWPRHPWMSTFTAWIEAAAADAGVNAAGLPPYATCPGDDQVHPNDAGLVQIAAAVAALV